MKYKEYPSQELIKKYFQYKNGKLYWKTKSCKNTKINSLAGTYDKDGYNVIGFKGQHYKAHRLIWIYFNNTVDIGLEIDHIDHNVSNNKIENLRLVSRSGNNWNRKNVKGYSLEKYSYSAYITKYGKKINLGYYKTEEEAKQARLKGEKKYHIYNGVDEKK